MNKHDVNIKKGKLINFQIGVIAVISFCYVMHEVSHYTPNKKKEIASTIAKDDDPYQIALGPVIPYKESKIIIEKPTEIKSEPKQEPVKITPEVKPQVVDNSTKIETIEKKTTSSEPKTDAPSTQTNTPNKQSKIVTPAITTHSKRTVDVMPVFPGCHKYSSNDDLAVCFQEKIQRMINRKFDRGIGEELGISGKQHISLYFEINEQGQVSNIRARSKHPEFIKEAKRVASLLPKMEPARRSGQKVTMAYNVPITFLVKN